MKAVIDTNVLVSAILRDRLPERVVSYVASRPDIQWIVTAAIIAEYQSVLSRPKFGLPVEELGRQFDFIEAHTVMVENPADVEFPRDRKDAKFLACASAASADFLITGDRDFLEAQRLVATRIVTVATFARIVGFTEI